MGRGRQNEKKEKETEKDVEKPIGKKRRENEE